MSSTNNDGKLRAYSHGFKTLRPAIHYEYYDFNFDESLSDVLEHF